MTTDIFKNDPWYLLGKELRKKSSTPPVTYAPEQQQQINEATKGGWYIDPSQPTDYTGTPETKQEKEWISNFILEQGRLPTSREASTWINQQKQGGWGNTLGWEFSPDSGAYKAGYRTFNDLRNVNIYGQGQEALGPYAGSATPEWGSIVLTDEKGNPLFRATQNSDRTQSYIKKGWYITPPEGPLSEFTQGAPAGFTDVKGIYKKYQPPVNQEWKQPAFEELAKTVNPNEFYQMQLSDYLQSKLVSDLPQYEDLTANLEGINQRLTTLQENITEQKGTQDTNLPQYEAPGGAEKQYSDLFAQKASIENQLSQLLSPDIANNLLSTAQYYASINMPIDQLKSQMAKYGINDADVQSLGIKGANALQWYNDQIAASRKTYDEQMAASGVRGGGGGTSRTTTTTRTTGGGTGGRGGAGGGGQPVATGTEKGDFLNYVKNLGVSYNNQSWLLDQFSDFIAMWQASDQPAEFMTWVQGYLAGEGANEYGNLPPGRRGEQTWRYNPPVRFK